VAAKAVRTSLDIPQDLHRRLHELAAKRGCSARQLILQSIENAVMTSEQQRPKRRLRLERPLVPLTGKPIRLTEDQIHSGPDFP
jgi:hypothetical protein